MKIILTYSLFEMNGWEYQQLENLIRNLDDPEEIKILSKAKEDVLSRMSKKTKIPEKSLEKLSLGVADWEISQDGKINAKTNVYFGGKKMGSIKDLNFGHVEGNFSIWGNDLTSLEGSPETISGDFDAENNRLDSLVGGPKKVGGDYVIGELNWSLLSLEGAPEEIGGVFSFRCPSLEKVNIEKNKYNLEGMMDLLYSIKERYQKEDIPFIFTHPLFNQSGNAKKAYREFSKEMSKIWDFVPEDFKKRISEETGESSETVEDTIQKFSDLNQRFF
jgi:hypothetical protein